MDENQRCFFVNNLPFSLKNRHRKSVILFFMVILFGIFSFSCFKKEEPSSSPVLAKVNQIPVTRDQFEYRMKQTLGAIGTQEQKTALLDRMIQQEIYYQAALSEGVDKDPFVINLIRQITISHLKKKQLLPLLSAVKITEDDIQAFYLSKPEKFTLPPKRRAAFIKLQIPANASENKKQMITKRAQEAYEKALILGSSNLSLGAVAVKYSDDQASRYRGGDQGWVTLERARRKWGSTVADALFGLTDAGQVASLIQTETYFLIIRLMDKKTAVLQPLPALREQIRFFLMNQEKARIEKEFYAAFKSRAKIEIDQKLLTRIPAPAGQKPFQQNKAPALPTQ